MHTYRHAELEILTPQHGTARTVFLSIATGQSLLDLASGFLHNLPTPPERLASSRTRPQYLSQNNSDHSHLALDILSAFPPTANHGTQEHFTVYRQKNNFPPIKPCSWTTPCSCTVSCSCTARHSCTMPASVTPTPPSSRAPTYVCTHAVPGSRLPGAAWRSSVSSSSPSFPTPFLA